MKRRPGEWIRRARRPAHGPGLFLLLACLSAAAWGAGLKGTVRDARGGEPLAGVKIVLECGGTAVETRSGRSGEFALEAAGDCIVSATLVGYRPLRLALHEDTSQVELALAPEYLARSDTVTVEAGPFEIAQIGSPSERSLTGSEMKNLAAVLIDDPLRAVQSLPGVASNNEYNSEFSLRGASFDRIGLYVDGILLHAPFHSVRGVQASGSLTVVNGDAVEEMSLHAGAPPVVYGDRTAGALDIRLREGSRRGLNFRVSAGVAASGLTAEGPLGGRGSWIATVRKSYLQYLLRRSAAETTMAFGFLDVQSKLSYSPSPKHNLTLSVSDGLSDLDRSRGRDRLGVNSVMLADYRVSGANLGWRYAPSSRAHLSNRLAAIRERCENLNPLSLSLGRCAYGEWIWNSEGAWSLRPAAALQGGVSVRRLRDEGESSRYQFNPLALRWRDPWRGTGARSGAFVQQSWSSTSGLVAAAAGVRLDHHSRVAPLAVSPHASLIVRLLPSTRLQFAASQAAQYPELQLLTLGLTGNPNLPPLRSTHLVAAIEQRIGERSRLRLEAWERSDRDLPAQPLLEPRLLPDGRIYNPPPNPPWVNSQRARARGVEVFLQRRSANRLSGWISYAYGRAIVRDSAVSARFFADYDQRHAVNIYASIRLRPTVNLSSRYSYGSNFPAPGWYRRVGDLYYLAGARNLVRLPAYHRADVRLNKVFNWKDLRGTLFLEVSNLFDKTNLRYDSFSGYNARTGQAFPVFDRLFPILPAAGVMLEWNSRGWSDTAPQRRN
jgi:hypothetical protein